MKRRVVAAVGIIRGLLLTALLLCATNATPGERFNSTYEKTRGPAVSAVIPAAQISAEGLIAFSADDQIYTMKSDGSDLRLITDDAPHVVYRYPTLSPDGSQITYTRDEGNDHALYVADVDGRNLRRLTSSSSSVAEPAWSPDGSKIAYIRGYDTTYGGLANITSCGPEIYVIDVFSRKSINLTQGVGGVDPTWSPDGTRIAFSSARNNNYDIYVMNADGSGVKQLTYTSWSEAEPAWSPDGKRIAYTANLRTVSLACGFMSTGRPGEPPSDDRTSVYVMSEQGTNHTKLATGDGGMEPAWSPDGLQLALAVVDVKGEAQIYVTDVNGTSLAKLTGDSTQKASPSWSYAITQR
jgi:Tol biopolymer transport system component